MAIKNKKKKQLRKQIQRGLKGESWEEIKRQSKVLGKAFNLK